MLKSTGCSSGGLGSVYQYSCGSSELAVAPILRDVIPSFDLYEHQVCTWWCTDIGRQNTKTCVNRGWWHTP